MPSKKSTSRRKSTAKGVSGSALSNGSKKKISGERTSVVTGTDKRYVRRDAQGRFVEKANVHMERAWGKIYDRSGKAGASKK